MLQNVRDNMKGTVAIIVVAIFVVPMVITGFGDSSFLSGFSGSDAAKVNKQTISRVELNRAIYQQRERMKAQGVEATSEQLKEENLRAPVLQSLTQQAALVTTSKKAGMGISDEQIYSAIQEAPQFQTNGKFDREVYKQQIAYQGHTPATFKEFVADILLVQQNFKGLNTSSFVTEAEVDAMIAIAQEKRSFALIELPADDMSKTITVADDEIASYYASNQAEFVEAEKMSIEYLELSVNELMQDIKISEEAVEQRYQDEKIDFEAQGRDAEVQIAHLMLEKKSDASQSALIEEIKQRLENGEDFAALVKEFSVDEGSRDNGGDLGVLIKGTFSEEFEAAAYALDEGEVSEPIETDSGIHFIKSLAKNVESFPSLEEKRKSIEDSLKRSQAEELYAQSEQNFEDMTFSAGDLKLASETLNLKIKESDLFERGSGSAIASNKAVRDAAWVDEVLLDGRNSPKIQLAPGHAVVLRKKEHIPEHVLPFETVKASIEVKLRAEKLAAIMSEEAAQVITALKDGEDLKALSEQKGYSYNEYKQVKRYDAPVDFQVREAAFQLAAGDDVVYDSVSKANGNQVVIALSEVIKGKREDMPEQQIEVLKSQLLRENASAEIAAYQAKVVNSSNIRIY